MPFYKIDNDEVIKTDFTTGIGYDLNEQSHADYNYPVDGWYYAPDIVTALTQIRGTPSNILTPLEFLSRFTETERITIRSVAVTNTQLSDFLYLLQSAANVDLSYPSTIQGVQFLETCDLIETGRADIILQC